MITAKPGSQEKKSSHWTGCLGPLVSAHDCQAHGNFEYRQKHRKTNEMSDQLLVSTGRAWKIKQPASRQVQQVAAEKNPILIESVGMRRFPTDLQPVHPGMPANERQGRQRQGGRADEHAETKSYAAGKEG